MVQSMLESKLSDYALPKTDTGRPIYDKKLPLPMNTKKTVLRDLQNENTNTTLTCMESPAFLKENGPEIEPVMMSTQKKTESGNLVNQSQSVNAVNGHLVYVRRKPEAELPNSNKFAKSKDNFFCSPPRKVGNQHQTMEEKLQDKDPPNCMPEIASTATCELTCFPSGKPSVPPSLGKSPNNLETMCSDPLALSISICPSDYQKRMNNQYWEKRYCQLQDLLETLDHSNQEHYVQMLRSLSSEGLSSQAIGLEKRSIQLSLEEAKELQRVQQLDVLGKYAKNSRVPGAQQG